MRSKLFLILLGALTLHSCNKKEMEISRSDYSVITEMHDFSPAYITNDKGKVTMNKNSLIGNTHWIVLVERDLLLSEIAPFLQELTNKKYKKGGMHEDHKDIYFIYSDTVHAQNAYVKFPFKKVFLEKPLDKKGIVFDKEVNVELFVNKLIKLEKQNALEEENGEVFVY